MEQIKNQQTLASSIVNPQPPPINPTSKKNSLLILIGIFLILLAILTGVVLGKYLYEKKGVSPTNETKPTINNPSPTSLPLFSPTPDPTAGWKTYIYEDKDIGTGLKFSVKYPPDWFLESGVLASYDMGKYLGEKPIPEVRIKCDFYPYNSPNNAAIKNEKLIINEDIKVYRGIAEDKTGLEGPGFGDNVLFLIKDKAHMPVGLLCFSYNESLFPILKQIFNTFEFLTPPSKKDIKDIESLINTFEKYNQQKKIKELMSLFTPPKTPQEIEIYNSIMGLDNPNIGPRLFNNSSSNYKLISWEIIDIQKINSQAEIRYAVDVEEKRDNGTTNTGEYLGIQKETFVFEIIKENDRWLVDKYVWPGARPETPNNPLKYRGLGF